MARRRTKKKQPAKNKRPSSTRGSVARPHKVLALTVRRKRAENRWGENEQQLKIDLTVMKTLNELAMLSARAETLPLVLERIVDAASSIVGSDFGNIQLLDPTSGDLKIVAQCGFPTWWCEFWNKMSKGQGVCGTALERGQRVIVEDVERSPIFADAIARDIQLKVGVRAVQSTPLVSRTGKVLGMFSTHCKRPYRPDTHTLSLLDLLIRQAADLIERTQAEAALRESEARFHSFFENAAIGAAQINATGRFIHLNDRFSQIMGYSCDELVGKMGPLNLDHPDEVEADRRRIADFFRKGTPIFCMRSAIFARTAWLCGCASP